ncbi:MAG: hypothetical protein ABUL48_05385 [Pseudorhodoplanes sp.]
MLLGDFGVYLIGCLIGVMAIIPFLWMTARNLNPDNTQLSRALGLLGGAAGGCLGVAVIGPIGQLIWQVVSDMVSTNPERSGQYLWPYPVSLWYSALSFGAVAGGLYIGFLATLVAKRRTGKARS